MSISYNKVILVGRTTRVPEVKMTTGMQKVVNFTLAVDREFGRDSETDFFNCVAFGKTADTIASYVGKGVLILVEGRLEIAKWGEKTDSQFERAKIIVNNFRFLETKKSRQENETIVEEKKEESYEDLTFTDDDFDKILNEGFEDD
jgi:single-strand DNA-binding protein